MKFTSEDLMKAMGLQIGDKVRVNGEQLMTVASNDCGEIKLIEDYIKIILPIEHLLNRNIEILPKPKRVGDTLCKDTECEKCPLRMVQGCENVLSKFTLYRSLEEIKDYNENHDSFDQEIHDLLKARLDKEVNE
jgi:hypothetical protein